MNALRILTQFPLAFMTYFIWFENLRLFMFVWTNAKTVEDRLVELAGGIKLSFIKK